MSAIRQPGKVNESTTLIDIGMWGSPGTTAVYLIEAGKRCLIDGGTKTEAHHIVQALQEQHAWPPDLIVVTHSHWDHIEGIPYLQKEAAQEGKAIQVLVSHQAVPLPGEEITDIALLKEGDVVDLGGTALRIYEIPGHDPSDLAILDEKTGTVFVGDAIGYKFTDHLFIPGFASFIWERDAFYSSVDKLKHMPYESLGLAHFGYIYGREAKSILDEAVSAFEKWWPLIDANADRLDDVDYMIQTIVREIGLDQAPAELLRFMVGGLILGYRSSKESHAAGT